ncbi:ThiJ/PfpI domain-containing protein [Sinorhizobium meliloti CCNWSX0020]|uniref:ThiJ/PfpI domain-containing protein n=1 Tax=Sinorhizobium meliloti CCNWSX0020 TaxID=1107881 RepID=H0FU22_RHIML|nr:ThiJ/PfpI domain-containing protein [Sinorhizobium meliloti CCNWSX0020]
MPRRIGRVLRSRRAERDIDRPPERWASRFRVSSRLASAVHHQRLHGFGASGSCRSARRLQGGVLLGNARHSPCIPATPVNERVVKDRNRITGGGITAGLHFGLELAAELRGEKRARLQQLIMEYDPKPSFDSGSLVTASPETVAHARELLGPSLLAIRAEAARAARRRG